MQQPIARFLRKTWVFYVLICLPLILVFVPIGQGSIEYLSDPAKFLLEYIGKATTILLVIVMVVTPLRMLFPKSPIIKAFVYRRRQIGVSVFAYALLHFLFYIPYTGSLESFFADWDKFFIISGLVALGLLFVLAVTSNNWSMRKLTAKRWKLLHKLAYPTVALVMYHQVTQEKSGYEETLLYFSPLILLEGYRVVKWLTGKR